MKNCPKCGMVVEGLFCPKCEDPRRRPAYVKQPIPSHVRRHLDEIKAKAKGPPPRMRDPGEEG